jgi:spermidine synthase
MQKKYFIILFYSAAILIGAFLNFLIQPLIGKIITPVYGGTSQVWCLCLLFFQLALLAGYSLAYVLSFFSLRKQAVLYAFFMTAALFLLNVPLQDKWAFSTENNPVISLLLQLIKNLSVPVIMLSTVSTVFQRWFNKVTGENPYYLYSISNIGSFSALLFYPLLIEPNFAVENTVFFWKVGYYILFVVALITIFMLILSKEKYNEEDLSQEENDNKISLKSLLQWIFLSACGTILLISYTNHLVHDIAPVPMLWIIPLSLYLMTFILCFGSRQIYNRLVFIGLSFFFITASALLQSLLTSAQISFVIPLMFDLPTFFLLCMICNGELYNLRPAPQKLSVFYLFIALGGALGGIFVNLIAPVVFDKYIELSMIMMIMTLYSGFLLYKYYPGNIINPKYKNIYIALICLLVINFFCYALWGRESHQLFAQRNFYGTAKVIYSKENDKLILQNGNTIHGLQAIDKKTEDFLNIPTSYFGYDSTIDITNKIMRELYPDSPKSIGIIGLGVGTIAYYGEKGDDITFFEIDPKIISIAKNNFAFLKTSKAKLDIILGDGRLCLKKQNKKYDIFIVDAFSSDSIPVHLLTEEAVALYKSHLKKDGVLVFHVSNRFLDLNKVLANAASKFDYNSVNIISDPQTTKEDIIFKSNYVVFYKNENFYKKLNQYPPRNKSTVIYKKKLISDKKQKVWTDNYNNLFSVIKFD